MEEQMEIRIGKEELQKAVSRVQSIIEKRSNMPILSMILVSAAGSEITLSATDLEISLQQKISAQVVAPGKCDHTWEKTLRDSKREQKPNRSNSRKREQPHFSLR
jgi:hypothetical protein